MHARDDGASRPKGRVPTPTLRGAPAALNVASCRVDHRDAVAKDALPRQVHPCGGPHPDGHRVRGAYCRSASVNGELRAIIAVLADPQMPIAAPLLSCASTTSHLAPLQAIAASVRLSDVGMDSAPLLIRFMNGAPRHSMTVWRISSRMKRSGSVGPAFNTLANFASGIQTTGIVC